MKRKREAIEAEPDPVAEIQKHLNMVEEDKCKLQTHLKEKRAYSDKLNHLVSIHEQRDQLGICWPSRPRGALTSLYSKRDQK